MDRGPLPVARADADAFEERSLLNDEELETAIARGLERAKRPDTVTAARTALGRLGFVWRPETEPM